MRFGICDLLGAGIGRDDTPEMIGQQNRKLSITATTIESEIVCGRCLREDLGKLWRIGWPVESVGARIFRKMIFKCRRGHDCGSSL
ncbi:MAG TPA: hypothetical protein VKA94_01195 [Hyphomicrobiales bacterium]|nr:hypothetical protein [Hyphomicrobiales bacterium]